MRRANPHGAVRWTMAVLWRILLLGELRAEGPHGRVSRFGTRQTAHLLGYLACHPGRLHPREVLVELLWPGVEPRAGRNRLNVALSALRQQLEPDGVPRGAVVQSDRHSAGLSAETTTTDLAELATAVSRARRQSGNWETGLVAALERYRGPLLEGGYDDWILEKQRRACELFVEGADLAARARMAAGDCGEALRLAQRAVWADPLREEPHLLAVRAAAAAQDLSLARQLYDQMSSRLAEALDMLPSVPFEALVAGAQRAPRDIGGLSDSAVSEGPVVPGTTTCLAWVGGARSSLADVVQSCRGRLIGGAEAAFATAHDAVRCAAELVPEGLRLALHTGDPVNGLAPLRAMARQLAAVAYPGQVLASASAAQVLADPADLRPLGAFRLPGSGAPMELAQVLCEGARRQFPALALPPALEGHVPVTLSRFFDRSADAREIRELLEQGARLVTLTAGGGWGKTRLAVELARALLPVYSGAVWFVPLAALTDPSAIPERALDVMGLEYGGGEATDRLVYELRRQPSLLILDNFEHLPAEAAAVVLGLLQRVPALACLVTSRHRLSVPGEREYALAPLPGSDSEAAAAANDSPLSPAVALFADRAQAAQPNFRVTPRNAAIVAALCDRLDGLPLAIELAAARAQSMTPAAMLASLDERLDWAASRRSGLPARQRTLRATLDFSFDLLSEPLQRFLLPLAVFRGSFTADAAAHVTGDPTAAERLMQLRGYSLVQSEAVGDELRCSLLATVRDYLEQRGDADALAAARQRHASHYLALPADLPSLVGQPALMERVGTVHAELDDLRPALAWSLAHEPHDALAAAVSLAPVWEHAGHEVEGSRWLAQALEAAPDGPPALRAAAMFKRGQLGTSGAQLAGDPVALAEALALYRALDDVAGMLQTLMWLSMASSAAAEVTRYRAEADALARRAGTPTARMLALVVAWSDESMQDHGEASLACLDEAASLACAQGDPLLTAMYCTQAAICHTLYDHAELATGWLQRIPPEARPQLPGWVRLRLDYTEAILDCRAGRLAAAALTLRSGIEAIVGGVPRLAYVWSFTLADLASRTHDVERGALLMAHAAMVHESAGRPPYPCEARWFDAITADLRAQLGPAQFSRLWQRGGQLPLADAAVLMHEVVDRVLQQHPA